MQTEQQTPAVPAPGESPGIVAEWLREARTGGVHLPERGEVRYVPWSQVHDDVEQLHGRLAERGVRPGSRIGIRGHNSYQWLVLDLALLRLGAVPVAVPVPDFKGTSNAELTTRYGLAAVFAGPESRSAGDGESVAPLERVLEGTDVTPLSDPPPPEGKQVLVDQREVFTLAFSSGTAGRVKCLLLAWRGVEALVQAQSAAHPMRPEDRIMIALPLSTFQQRYLCYLAIRNGCDIVLTTAARFVQALPATRPTFLLGPPNFYEFVETRYRNLGARQRLLRDAAAGLAVLLPRESWRRGWRRRVFRSFHEMYGGSMRLMMVGSAPVRPGMLEFFARAGFELYQIYGMTEIGYLTWNRPGANRMGSVGRQVYPGTVEVNEAGEVLVRHAWHLCIGYEGESPDDVAQVFRASDTVATGDLGAFDQDGFLHLKGRKKNLIITTGGQKLQMEDLEAELCRVRGVDQAALFTVDGGGMAVAAWVQGDEGEARSGLLARVGQINSRLVGDLKIRAFTLVEGTLSADSPLLNRNLKINREAVRAAVADRLEPLD
ncbi:AMP-binding protein [Streptacidiphilus griseoplanus]|uniref:AMP-binding protein n=1 Tax=Peterkaempfera griseoplana TaxID=66896 RepID=UPI0006E26997|nr:AMP-binding protein [Peterkaempfera griseoplana]BCN13441.1 AMP-dependent ligase [Peterkaempfera griseoplana]